MSRKYSRVNRLETPVSQGFDGWLLYDFRGSNILAQRVVGLAEKKLSRRWFYFVPAQGEPRKLVHAIEPASLDGLPGKTKTVYRRWQAEPAAEEPAEDAAASAEHTPGSAAARTEAEEAPGGPAGPGRES